MFDLFVSLGEAGILIVYSGLTALGFATAMLFPRASSPVGRGRYIFLIGLTMTAIIVLQLPFIHMVDILAAGVVYLDAMILVTGAGMLAAGWVFGSLARMRSIDAFKGTLPAWLGIVPFLNLILWFAPTFDEEAPPPLGGPLRFAPRGVVGGLLGIALIAGSTIGNRAILADTPPGGKGSPQAYARAVVAATRARMTIPGPLNPGVRITDFRAEGASVIYVYEIEKPDMSDPGSVELAVINSIPAMCAGEGQSIFEHGVSVRMDYEKPDGSSFASMTLPPDSCRPGRQAELLAKEMETIFQPMVPRQVEGGIFTGAKADGQTLVLSYSLTDKQIADVRKRDATAWSKWMTKKQCTGDLRRVIEQGMSLGLAYYGPHHEPAMGLAISTSDCEPYWNPKSKT